MTRLWERSCVVLSALTLACALVLLAQFQGLLPWSEQPIRLDTSSELSGEMSVFLNTENPRMLQTTVTNQNGAKIIVSVDRGTMTVAEHRQAFKDEVAFWKADTTIQP